MAATRNVFVETFWKIHRLLYQWSGGRIGGKLLGLPVLMLTTTGRKSGQLRTRALMYLPRGDDFVVIASYLGEPRHPAWWLNLEANADAEIQVGNRTIPVRAREADGDERKQLWKAAVEKSPDYDEYQKRTKRRIPVVVLEPR